jgi:pyrroloquinoline quinone biosynthesis protein B
MKLRIPMGGSPTNPSMQAPLLSPDGRSWCLLGAGGGVPQSPHAVVLTGAHKHHVDGLLDLRAGGPINLYATPAVFEHLTQALPLLPVLQQYCGVQWHLIAVAGDRRQADFTIVDWPMLQFTAMTLDRSASGDGIALAVHDAITDRRLFMTSASAFGRADPAWLDDTDCILLSGPMPSTTGPATHWLDRLAELPPRRKILLHAAGDETPLAALAERGIEHAFAGMEIDL